METKAPYVVVGIFALAVVGGMMAFVHWAVSNQMQDEQTRAYIIDFDGSVAGLNPTGEVYFNGIKVGQVSGMGFVPEDPHKVRVQIKIAAGTPVRSDAVAYLQYQGITGVTEIQIEGGRPDSPPLVAGPGQPLPRIASRDSQLRQVMQKAPELLKEATRLMAQARQLFSPENLAATTRLLANLEHFTGDLAAQEDAIPRILDSLNTMADQLVGVARRLETIAGQAEGVLGNANSTLAATEDALTRAGNFIHEDLRQTTRQVASLAENIDGLIQTAGPGITRFSNQGLLSLSQLIKETRLLLATLDRVGQRLESEPGRFLFGDQVPEVAVP